MPIRPRPDGAPLKSNHFDGGANLADDDQLRKFLGQLEERVNDIAESPGGGGGGVTDHGELDGLADDDHPQYMPVDGSRAFTGNPSIPTQLMSAGSNALLAATMLASCDTGGGDVDITLPSFTGARSFVIHKRSEDDNVIRIIGTTVNGQASPYTLAGSDLAYGSWMLWRTSAGVWYISPGAVDTAVMSPSGATQGDILYHNGTEFTRLALGTSGQVLTAGASAPAWQNAAGGGGLAAVNYLRGWADAVYYDFGSNPLTAQSNWLISVLAFSEAYEQSNRTIISCDDGFGGGVTITINGEALTARVTDNDGALQTLALFSPPMVNRWMVISLRYVTVGGDARIQLYINGSCFMDTFVAAAAGAITGGGNLIVGNRGGIGQGATQERINGAGFALRNVTPAEVAAHARACVAAGQMVDIPSGGSFTAGWRVGASEPGATWTPFVGAGALARSGAALTHGQDTAVIYRG